VDHVNGVKNVWDFHRLPYAADICVIKDYMHTASNIITDSISVLCAAYGTKKNRCNGSSVRADCIAHTMHRPIYPADGSRTALPWVFSHPQCSEADASIKRVIGASSFEIIKKVLVGRGADNCHDTIYWATTFAPWALRTAAPSRHVDNKLQIFNLLGMLNSGRMDREFGSVVWGSLAEYLSLNG